MDAVSAAEYVSPCRRAGAGRGGPGKVRTEGGDKLTKRSKAFFPRERSGTSTSKTCSVCTRATFWQSSLHAQRRVELVCNGGVGFLLVRNGRRPGRRPGRSLYAVEDPWQSKSQIRPFGEFLYGLAVEHQSTGIAAFCRFTQEVQAAVQDILVGLRSQK